MSRRASVFVALAVASVALAACHKKDAGSCRTEAIQLPQILASVEHAPTELALGTTTLVERDDLPALVKVERPVVALHGAVSVQQAEVAVNDVGTRLAAAARGTSDYLLAIDASEPWSRIVDVIISAKLAGFTGVQVVFARRGNPDEAPPRTPIDTELDSIFAERRSSDLVAIARRTVSRCPALQATFAMVGGDATSRSGADARSTILAQLTPSLLDCDCNVDLPELHSILYRLYANPRPVSTLRLVIDDGAPAVELGPATTWRDASKSLVGGNLSVRVTAP